MIKRIKTSGIYQIRNLINNKIYIGSSYNLDKRNKTHFKTLKLNTHSNRHLQDSFNIYGEKNFVFEILEYIIKLENETTEIFEKRLRHEREQHYLDTLLFASENDSRFDELGYNGRRLADSNIGTLRSEETKIKLSKSLKYRKLSEQHVLNIVKSLTGHHRNAGSKHSKPRSEESRLRTSISSKNEKRYKCDYCDKEMKKCLLTRWHNENCKLNPKNRAA